MKRIIIFYSLLLISSTCFCKKVYTMSVNDLTDQFDKNISLRRFYCFNEKQEKVLLFCNENSTLILNFKDRRREKLYLGSIRYYDGIIQGSRVMAWNPDRDTSMFDISEILSISIVLLPFINDEYERPYFNAKDSIKLAKQKNDSIRKIFRASQQNEILIIQKINSHSDTFRIMVNACYNIKFDDGNETFSGVVQKITKDSIFISNYFNNKIAIKFKKVYQNLAYPISQINTISLRNSNYRTFTSTKIESNKIIVQQLRKKDDILIPYWYFSEYNDGEINLYRLLQTYVGISGITEINNSLVWYEGD